MSLFGSIQIANNALHAAQVGLQVTANNIANANTPGYLRQRVALDPAPTQKIGNLPLGLGVEVAGIIQQTDRFLSERLRGSISDLANAETQKESYVALEALAGELSDTDLSTTLGSFLSSIHDILNQPEDVAVRNYAVLQGSTLADEFRRLTSRVHDMRRDVNEQIVRAADDVNRLLMEIAELNSQIVVTEAGTSIASDAVGLRDQRETALAELAELIGIRSVEQPDGSATVFAGGDVLVFAAEHRRVAVSYTSDSGLNAATLHVEATDAALNGSSGKLAGLYAARDEILRGFVDDLNDLARVLAFDFNKVYASGQGLTGFQELRSAAAVFDAEAALDQAGLAFTPVNGSLQFLVRDMGTGLTTTNDILVELNGLEGDTTLISLAEAIDAVDGIRAEVSPELGLSITSESPLLEFSFANDTSGVLAALGVNTFFTGTTAEDLEISDAVLANPALFAAARGGIGSDSENAVLLADFGDQPLESQNGQSLLGMYERMMGEMTQGSAVSHAVSEGFRVFHHTLEGQHLGLSGVSIDEEAVNMITFQRMYQASARFISTISELLDVLMRL